MPAIGPAAADDTDDSWPQHPWEDEPADAAPRRAPAWHPGGPAATAALDTPTLLAPLAQASTALARLQARLEVSGPDVAEGWRARWALREAAGWLAHQHRTWVHPTDLGLREAGLTGSVTAAALRGRLTAALPATTAGLADAGAPGAAGAAADTLADDAAVAQSLELGRLWRRLAERQTWAPLADVTTLRQLLAHLGSHGAPEAALTDWLGHFAGRPRRAAADPIVPAAAAVPALLRAGQAAQAWSPQAWSAQAWPAGEPDAEGRGDRLSTAALFLAACCWRRAGDTPSLALPLWSATPQRLDALGLTAGPAWLAGFLGAVAEAAQRGGQELGRLQAAAARAATLRRTARSRLPAAAALALRFPVLTAGRVARTLGVSHQAATALLRGLAVAGVLKEATGRAAWRAFVVA